MGRPINPNYIGNTSGSSQTIAMQAWIPGDPGPTSAYILAQKASQVYLVANAAGGTNTGRVTLVNGPTVLQQGQANVTVTPFGGTGTGAVAAADLGLYIPTLVSTGTGSTANYFITGETLSPSSGTSTAVANVSVANVTVGSIVANAGSGPGYTVGDKFTWSQGGFQPWLIVGVASTSGNGNISGVQINQEAIVSNASVTNATPFSSSVQTNTWASGATFAIQWIINDIAIKNIGNYSIAPGNPVALTGSAHGIGATMNVVWQVSTVAVSNGGTGYNSADVVFSYGNAEAIGAVNAAGSITGVTVTYGGSDYTAAVPTVTFPLVAGVQYASAIMNRTVTTFSGNTYTWVDSATIPTASNQAQLQTL